MELPAPIPFPQAVDTADETVLTEIDVAIALVASGVATRVRVASVSLQTAERVAGTGAAHAGSANVRFVLERSAECATFTVGP
jgi:carbon monoxide dehydrogenase subunit G